MASSVSRWTRFIQDCLHKRVKSEDFRVLLEDIGSRHVIAGSKLALVLLATQKNRQLSTDIRLQVYTEVLLEKELTGGCDLLSVMALLSRRHFESSPEREGQREAEFPKEPELYPMHTIIVMLELLARGYMGRRLPKTQADVKRSLGVLFEWLERLAAAGSVIIVDPNPLLAPLADALGVLALAMLENAKVVGVITSALSKELRSSVASGLTAFLPVWTQASPDSAQYVGRLQHSQRTLNLIPPQSTMKADETALAVAAAVQLQSIVDLPPVNARAGVFIFLQALLQGCPNADEGLIVGFLHSRSKGSISDIVTDLIAGSFDLLAASMEKRESADSMFVLRFFLTNKVPLVLTALMPSIFAASLTPVYCISQALGHVDASLFPPPSLGMMTDSVLPDIRQEFLFACSLHSLVPAQDLEALLGEAPMIAPPSMDRRYLKHDLLQQCASNPERISQLINELDGVEGNSGAIATAVAELIRNACNSKDTMFLKSTCGLLHSKPQRLDALVQFMSPMSLLQPICLLLDSWTHDDDQGEYQPVYEEFASIFLFVLALVARYNLDVAALGLGHESFVVRLLSRGYRNIRTEDLDDEQNKHLASWVKGLFDPDGMTNEVTSSCRPQQFYLLVPTILESSIWVCAEGVLNLETLKNGLEYLLEPFLLPSLVIGIQWICRYGRMKPRNQQDVMLQVLQHLLRAPSGSPEAESMHNTALSVIAQPLTHYLNFPGNSSARQNDINALKTTLEPHLKYSPTPFALDSDTKLVISTFGSVQQTLKNSLQSLCTWSMTATMNITQPPPADHRVPLFPLFLRVLGPRTSLRCMLEMIKAQTAQPDGSAALLLDIIATTVAASGALEIASGIGWGQPGNRIRLDPRSALQLEFNDVADTLKTDQLLAEAIVRLHRRVEALAAAPMVPMAEQTLSAMMPELDAGTAAAAAAAIVQPLDLSDAGLGLGDGDASQLGLGLGVGDEHGLDLLGGGGGMMGVDDDDVFAGLNLGDDFDMMY